MKKPKIILYSPIHLETWDWRTMDTTGIGGSETCHAELAFQFAKEGYDVISIAPCERKELGPGQVQWVPLSSLNKYLKEKNCVWLIFRDPNFFDSKLDKKTNKYYFVAQDVDYHWTDERLEKVDKYITLCKTHKLYTLGKYPQLKDKLYISSNGINSKVLKQKYDQYKDQKISKRVIYSSSPDRGLELILENWFRVEERHPDVQLDVYYGFDNLLKLSNGNDWRSELYYNLMNLAQRYKTVKLHGRINQNELHNEMAKSSIWFYPTRFPETSAITCMEIQALGVYPVVTDFWAVGENVFHGTKMSGNPNEDQMVKCCMFKELNNILSVDTSESMKEIRDILSEDALDSFDWGKIAQQYIFWFKNEN